ncbi:AAA family ATPase [Flavobacterium sp. '19STA2R22 D10 B1']|uniref:AAA family ATPase n=1 Tax=Flavobacterium aerium TaxID=3037261 RepID=UPI00278C8D3A|nr:AAA family ATPase [Flavobacterium sp. '19STA2R22 D10 B1']
MERIDRPNFIVITGGPGMGKTTLLNALQKQDYIGIEEVGRAIIQEQLQSNGTGLPWRNQQGFADLMLHQAMKDFKFIKEVHKPVFFDRGIPDVIGYLTLCHLEVPELMHKTAEYLRYNTKVFITPPWESIYTNDTERKQTFSEAIATYEIMLKTYTFYGYECIELPKTTIENRISFIQEKLASVF